MSVKPLTYYTVICDACGKDAGTDSDYSAWADEDEAQEQASNDDWLVRLGSQRRDFCARCAYPDGRTDDQDECAHEGDLVKVEEKAWRCEDCGLRIGPVESTEAGR